MTAGWQEDYDRWQRRDLSARRYVYIWADGVYLQARLSGGQLLADRAFDANWLREALAKAGVEAVIPPKSNRRFPAEFDRHTYKWRHLIENFFGKLKEYRGIATRCCKTDTSFTAFIAIAATVIRLH